MLFENAQAVAKPHYSVLLVKLGQRTGPDPVIIVIASIVIISLSVRFKSLGDRLRAIGLCATPLVTLVAVEAGLAEEPVDLRRIARTVRRKDGTQREVGFALGRVGRWSPVAGKQRLELRGARRRADSRQDPVVGRIRRERKDLKSCHSTNAMTPRIGGSRSATADEHTAQHWD
jgi:hypothetical protein